jgi:hypothetical protein
MAASEASGPHVGQVVYFSESATVIYPAMIVAINSDGTVRLSTFKPGQALADQNSILQDNTRQKANTWSWGIHSLTGV